MVNEFAKWRFPSNNGGQKQGLNDSGIETFKDAPIKSLAREICQNSLDASLDNKIVTVEFSTFELDKSFFPDMEGFANILSSCKRYWDDSPNQKTKDFFKIAIEKNSLNKIDFLRISDFNTTGLTGSDKKTGGDWDNLVNSSGISEKGESKGGSFGIGKNAPFACSNFRTIFYSTFDCNGIKASKGVSKLTSYKINTNKDGSDNISQGTGYYGIVNEYSIKHINDILNLDENFVRKECGTDIYVASFIKTEDFEAKIISEVLDSFIIAIWQNKLEIIVNGYKVNKNTLPNVVVTYKDYLNEITCQVYEILSNEKTEWMPLLVELNGEELGEIKLSFDLREDGTNKISMVRSSGMKIFDKARLCPTIPFTGLALIEGDKLNTFLRNLENPSHTKWLPERYEQNPHKARTLLKHLYQLITDKLNEVASSTYSDEIDIDGASDFLPDEIDDQNLTGNTKKENSSKIVNVDFSIKKKVSLSDGLEADELGDNFDKIINDDNTDVKGDEDEEYGIGRSGKNGEHKDNVGIPETDERYNQSIVSVKAKQIRVICINRKERIYRVIFIPNFSSPKGYISIERIAEQNEKMKINVLNIVNDSSLNATKNRVGYFNFIEGEQIIVDLVLDIDEYSSMGVKLHAYKS